MPGDAWVTALPVVRLARLMAAAVVPSRSRLDGFASLGILGP
jgi:hypothetical protein